MVTTILRCDFCAAKFRNEKLNSRKEKVFGPDVLWTSWGHSRGSPGSKISGRPSKPWKNKHLGADIHDPNTRTSVTPGGCTNRGIAKRVVKNRSKGGCKRLFAFVHVCSRLLVFVCVFASAFACVCQRLLAFVCVCSQCLPLAPSFVAPPFA